MVAGIDEAGRGPLAGPVAVGIAVTVTGRGVLPRGVKDSKQLSENKRQEIYRQAVKLQQAGYLKLTVCFTTPKMIDKWGIEKAVYRAIARGLKKLDLPPNATVLLDGRLQAPARYVNQRSIIKGDRLEPLISLASIAAKVERDRRMTRLAGNYPGYQLEKHKGYGTHAHRVAIQQKGLTDIHRHTFCQKLIDPV